MKWLWLQEAMDEKKLATKFRLSQTLLEMAVVTRSHGREEVGDETRFD